jgi:hypothetical protein
VDRWSSPYFLASLTGLRYFEKGGQMANELNGAERHMLARYRRILSALDRSDDEGTIAALLTVAAQLEEVDQTLTSMTDEPAQHLAEAIESLRLGLL